MTDEPDEILIRRIECDSCLEVFAEDELTDGVCDECRDAESSPIDW